MTKQEMLQLKMTATRVRMGIIEATHGGKSGHPGGSLSAADVLTYLYFKEMQIDPQNPQDPDRDRFVLSKGHAAPGLYSVLAERGFFPVADLPTLRRACCDELIIMSDDGSYGQKGVVTMPLEEKIKAGANFDEVITIGPLIMMKFVVKTTKPYNVKTVVSMNPIMVDGTGMCGGCRLTVGGKTKFACVDGPDFDGFEVDFDEAMHRGTMYRDFEAHAREAECNLLKKEVE